MLPGLRFDDNKEGGKCQDWGRESQTWWVGWGCFLCMEFCMKLYWRRTLVHQKASQSQSFKNMSLWGARYPPGAAICSKTAITGVFGCLCDLCKFIDIYDGACQLTRTHAVTLYKQCRGWLGIQKSVQNAISLNHADVEWPSTALWYVLAPRRGLCRNHGEHDIIGWDKIKGADQKTEVLRIRCLNMLAC